MKNKVVLIGCGNVGMSYAYALLNQSNYVNELALIDLDENRIIGEVMDLNHCLAFAPQNIDIHVGKYEDCRDANIVVIAAGANQKPGETRLDLIGKNAAIFKDIVSKVMANGFDGIFLIATNPLDIMTYLTQKFSGLPKERVIGTGTSLDTIRLQYLVGDKLDIYPKNVQAYVIGEHGDSEVVTWSNSGIGAEEFETYTKRNNLEWDDDVKKVIENDVKNAAYEIINRKKATYFAIGLAVNRIVEAIFRDENSILTVSSLYDGQYGISDMYLAIPSIVNRGGVKDILEIPISKEEEEKLKKSAEVLKFHLNKCNI